MFIQQVKKGTKLALTAALAFAMTACSSSTPKEETVEPVSILCPTGAPALSIQGAADLEDVSIEYVDGSDLLTSELAKEDGEYDIIVAPTNLGAKVYSESESYNLDAVLTWGNLYLVGPEGIDLKTASIAAFGQNAVPGLVFNQVEEEGLNVTWYSSAAEAQQALLTGQQQVALLAQPVAQATVAKAKENGKEMTEDRADHIGKISYNDRSSYRRGLLNSGVNIEYQANNFILSAVTGYQNLNDRMFLDQDFTERDIFNIEQKQRANTISEEIVLKAKPGKRWQWATGAFGFYQWLHTTGPVLFKEEGVKSVIENNANAAFEEVSAKPGAPTMGMTVYNPTLSVGGTFDTPTLSGALYHQSTFNNLFIEGLSVTAGLRLDYEKISMKYNSLSTPIDFGFDFHLAMGPNQINLSDQNMKAPASFVGKLSTDYVQLLPKFAIQYEWKNQNNVYATVTRGYRSGGYNIQMFSDLSQTELKNSMMNAIKESPTIGQDATWGKTIINMMNQMVPTKEIDVKASTTYKPEYSWNYEVGSHLTLWEGRLWADVAAFYMDTRDQQLSQFAESGLGRITINAGKSRSYGAEAALRASVTKELSLNVSYGYTYATFTDYVITEEQKDGTFKVTADYNGKDVPFVPKHTLNIGGEYAITCSPRSIFDRIVFQANYNAAGRIYWTEQNDVSQSFYGTLNWRTNLEIGDAMISFWARNFLNKEYAAFYFETMNKGFMQKGRPMQFGVDLRCRF